MEKKILIIEDETTPLRRSLQAPNEFIMMSEPPKGLSKPPCKRHEYVQKPGSTQKGNIIKTNPWVCKNCGREL